MTQKTNNGQWVTVENFKIYSNGLWQKTEPDNPLSELIEVSELEYIGLENDKMIYKCNEPPKEISDLIKVGMGDDTHVYLCVNLTDKEEKAMLWPY